MRLSNKMSPKVVYSSLRKLVLKKPTTITTTIQKKKQKIFYQQALISNFNRKVSLEVPVQ